MKISVFGLGYVGCVGAGCLAKEGHHVIGVDTDSNKVNLLTNGRPTILEEKIDELISEGHQKGLIEATTDYSYAVLNSEVSIVSVGTPSKDNGHLNLKYIFAVAEQIGQALKAKNEFHTIIIRSTVFPGTNSEVGKIIALNSGKKENKHFAVVTNPEFLREGSAISDYFNPPMIVIGSENLKGIEVTKELYQNIKASVFVTETEVAEMIKYVNNSFHALKVSFANEIGNVCKKMGIDSHKVMELFIKDTKLNLSPYYLKPGFAYGGSCLPKDLGAIKTLAHDYNLESPVIESIDRSNENQKKIVLDLILKLEKKNIGFVGLSFKDGSDDLRNSPLVDIIMQLSESGHNITIFDKDVILSNLIGINKSNIKNKIPNLEKMLVNDIEALYNRSDIIVVGKKDIVNTRGICNLENKIVVDLVRIDNFKNCKGQYYGICW